MVYCIICGQQIYQKVFLNWLCHYFLFSINRFCKIIFSQHCFSIDLKVWLYPTLLIQQFINFKLFCLCCSLQRVIGKSSQENLKVIKNTLPNKSGSPESLEKQPQQLESSLTHVYAVGEDLLRVFYKLFYLRFCISSDQ